MTFNKFLLYIFIAGFSVGTINLLGTHYYIKQINSGNIIKTTSDSNIGWVVTQNVKKYNLNDWNIRDDLSSDQLISDKRNKIVFLGNSVVLGNSVYEEPVFTEIIQKKINAELNGRFKVINAGIDGFDIWRTFNFYEKKIQAVKPKSVIWFPNVSDFRSRKSSRLIETEGQTVNRAQEKFEIAYLYSPIFFEKIAQKIYFETSLLNVSYLGSSHNQYYIDGNTNAISNESLNELDAEIKRFSDYLKNEGIDFYIYFLPPRLFSKLYGWAEATAPKQFESILTKYNIPHKQLFDFVHENGNAHLFIDYVHFNPQGHQVVGNKIFDDLFK